MGVVPDIKYVTRENFTELNIKTGNITLHHHLTYHMIQTNQRGKDQD